MSILSRKKVLAKAVKSQIFLLSCQILLHSFTFGNIFSKVAGCHLTFKSDCVWFFEKKILFGSFLHKRTQTEVFQVLWKTFAHNSSEINQFKLLFREISCFEVVRSTRAQHRSKLTFFKFYEKWMHGTFPIFYMRLQQYRDFILNTFS